MRIPWRAGGSGLEHLSFQRCVAVLTVHVHCVRHYAARGAADDGAVRRVLLRAVRRRHGRGELGDVADQALEKDSLGGWSLTEAAEVMRRFRWLAWMPA